MAERETTCPCCGQDDDHCQCSSDVYPHPEQETVTGGVYKDWVCCPKCQHIYFTSVDTVVDWRMTHIPIDFFARVGNCPNCGNTGLDSEKDSCRPIGRHSALRFRGKVHLPKGLTHISPAEAEGKPVPTALEKHEEKCYGPDCCDYGDCGDCRVPLNKRDISVPEEYRTEPDAIRKAREDCERCRKELMKDFLANEGKCCGCPIGDRIAAYTNRYGEEG